MQLQQHEPAFSNLGIQIAVVTFTPKWLVEAYVDETHVPWPVLIDETRDLYRAYGMLRAKLWDLWGPRTLWAYTKELVRGRLPKWPQSDTSQQGGDILIDPGGIVCVHHVGAGPADRPSVATLLRARGPSS